MDGTIYTCVCGKEFGNSQSFNSHKSQCKEHYIQKYGGLTEYEIQQKARHIAAAESLRNKAECKKQTILDLWLSAQPTCERCGKVMTEKFGSGRFCSRACANARDHSDETKEKIRQALFKPEELKKKRVRPKAEPKVKTQCEPKQKIIKPKNMCLVCGKELLPKHKYPYCAEHLREYQKQSKIEHWLKTGDMGLKPDTTIRGAYRGYILQEQNGCCAICGMSAIWNDQPLVFVLDHIDGDAANSARENLRLVCPNCDSQLDTYKAKNKNSARTSRKKYLQEIRDLDK